MIMKEEKIFNVKIDSLPEKKDTWKILVKKIFENFNNYFRFCGE